MPYPGGQAAVIAAAQRPLAASAFTEPSGTQAWKPIPSWAVIGTSDRVIPPAELTFMAGHQMIPEPAWCPANLAEGRGTPVGPRGAETRPGGAMPQADCDQAVETATIMAIAQPAASGRGRPSV